MASRAPLRKRTRFTPAGPPSQIAVPPFSGWKTAIVIGASAPFVVVADGTARGAAAPAAAAANAAATTPFRIPFIAALLRLVEGWTGRRTSTARSSLLSPIAHGRQTRKSDRARSCGRPRQTARVRRDHPGSAALSAAPPPDPAASE